MATIAAFNRQSSCSSALKTWLLRQLRRKWLRASFRLVVITIIIMVSIVILWTSSVIFPPEISLSGQAASSLSTDAEQHLPSLKSMVAANVSSTASGFSPSSPELVSPVSSTTTRRARDPQPVLQATDLPDATGWKPTVDTPWEVCFVTSVYSASADTSDRPPDVTDIQEANPSFQFFAFTNLPNLDAPGWTVKVKTYESSYRRYITQSRWAKFMGWKDESVQGCQAVFYMDGFCGPKLKHSERYKRLAKGIHDSHFGVFQNQHEIAEGPLDELDRIVERRKDIAKNVQASKAWLIAQPDFRPDAAIYENHYIGYNPKSIIFQQATQFFWDRYSLEEDSWRDQPLWSYVLDHFGIQPTRLGTFDALFKEYYKRMGHAGHRYNERADSNAVL